MGKRKKTIITAAITALIIGILVLCCFLYTKNREKYYADNPQYCPDLVIVSSESDYEIFDADPRGYAATGIFFSEDHIFLYPCNYFAGKQRELEIKPTKFEKYIIYDYLKNVLDIYNDPEYRIKQERESLHLFINVYVSGRSEYFIKLDPKGTLKTNILSFLLLTFLYSGVHLPFLALFYITVILLYRISGKSITTEFKSRHFSDYMKFMLVSILITFTVNFVFMLPPVRSKFIASTYYVMEYGAYLNWSAGCIAAFSELAAIMFITKSGKTKTGIAYAIPTVIMLFVQLLLLHRSKIDFLYQFQKNTIWKLHNEIIVFNEFWPFYPKVIYFTLFFILAFPIYFIPCMILEKKLNKGFCRAVSFSVSSALLVTMPSYLLMYCFRY